MMKDGMSLEPTPPVQSVKPGQESHNGFQVVS